MIILLLLLLLLFIRYGTCPASASFHFQAPSFSWRWPRRVISLINPFYSKSINFIHIRFKERPMADLDRLVSRTHGMSDNMTATRWEVSSWDSHILQEVHTWFAGCFAWRVMFGENTTRRESGSHCSQERRSADIRLVASYRATWCHLYCSSKASGQHLCRVWRKGIAGLELTWHRWVYPRLGIGLKWFCRMQLSQLWALSSCWRLPLIQPRLKWVKLLSIWQIIFLLCRKVSVGQHSATTWHATWPQQLKTRSSTTWWSTRGRTRPCYPPRHKWSSSTVYRDGAQLPAHKLVLASQTSYFEGLFRQENPDQVAETNNRSYFGKTSETKENGKIYSMDSLEYFRCHWILNAQLFKNASTISTRE